MSEKDTIYTSVNGTIVVDLTSGEYCSPDVPVLTAHTVNTWQPDRKPDETSRDTTQGKLAENVVAAILWEHSNDFLYKPYDAIRTDGRKKHAPFDGMLAKWSTDEAIIDACQDLVRRDVWEDEYGRISPKTREFCRTCGVYLVEIKSSKVSDAWMRRAAACCSPDNDPNSFRKAIIGEILRNGTIWKYPCFCRDSTEIEDYRQYARYVYDRHSELRGDGGFDCFADRKLPVLESRDASDIYIQAFVEYAPMEDVKTMVRVYVMGYALSTDIIKNKTIKKFYSAKSKNVLYMTLPLTESRTLPTLLHDDRLWGFR